MRDRGGELDLLAEQLPETLVRGEARRHEPERDEPLGPGGGLLVREPGAPAVVLPEEQDELVATQTRAQPGRLGRGSSRARQPREGGALREEASSIG